MTKVSTLIRQMAKEGHRLASLERASVLSASDDPKDQDKAREIRVRHDYENLRKQISSKKKPTKPAIKEGMGNIAHTKTKKGGKTIINVSKNDEADAQKAMKNDPKYILGKTRVQPYKEEVKRDEYGDPVGGPKISKKKKAKNLSSNTPDEQHTTTTSEAVGAGVPLTPQELEIQKKMSRLNVRLARKRSQEMQKAKTKDTETAPEQVKEGSLHKWFKGSKSKDGKPGWVNVKTGGTCASDEPGEGTPKCVSSSKRASMTKAERESASRRKKAADPNQQQKSGAAKPTYVRTDAKKKMKESKDVMDVAKELTKASKMHKGQAEKLKKHAKDMKETKNCGCGQDPCITYGKKEEVDEACWKGYRAKGMKKKGGKLVPNCKPIGEAKVDKGRSDYGKASIRNYRRMGPGHGDPVMFDPEGKRGKTIDKRREEHKARRGVKGAKVPAYKVEEVEVVNEVSKKTLGSYVKKAATEIGTSAIKGDYKKMQKRHKGVLDATDKMTKEEVEQIDELSKTTTANYLYHAKVDKNYVHGGKMGKYAKARDKGIKRAEKKLGKKTSDRVNYVADYDTRSMRQDSSKSAYPRKIKVKEEIVVAEADKKGKGSGTKDACYHKVKASAKVWPSAYASGRLVQCRKKGAANYGKSKSEEFEYETWKTDAILEKVAAWQRKEGKNPEGGLNQKGVDSYRRENPGSKLKTAVTTEPSKLKKGSKSANRRKSFCARMSGMKKKLTSAKTANDPDSRINKSLRKWNCSYEPEGTPIMEEDKAFKYVVDKLRKKHGKDAVITKISKPKPPTEAQKKKAAAERKKRQDADNKAYAARAKKAGFKSTQDYTNVVARYGSEDNYRKGKGLGT